jgi:hypothetical protein
MERTARVRDQQPEASGGTSGLLLFYSVCHASAPLPAALVVEELDVSFVVKDGAGQKVAYVHDMTN